MKSRTNTSGSNSCISGFTLLKYLKGELSGLEMNSVERHISGCEMCADELEGLSLLENPYEIDSIASKLNQRIDSTLANNNKTFWFSSPLRVAASIMVIVAISSLIYYTSTLTSTTTPLSENIITSERENILAEKDQEIYDSTALGPIIPEKKTAREKGEYKKKEKREEPDKEENIIADNLNEKEAVVAEFNDSKAQMDTPLEQAAGASALSTQERKKAAKPAPQAAKTISIIEDDVDLFEEVTIMYETDQDSNKAVVSYIAFSDEEEEFVEEEVFILVEEMPSFIHKDYKDFGDYIAQNLRYPNAAIESSIQGKVFISFIVEPDGNVSNVRVIKGVYQALDEEAVRVVKSSPRWKPGTQRGKPVRVSYTFPVIFVLQ